MNNDTKSKIERVARRLRLSSLAEHPTTSPVEILEGGVGFLLPFALVLTFTRWRLDNLAVLALLVVSSAVSAYITINLCERAVAAYRIWRLRRIGFGFNADRYLGQLAERRPNARLVVKVEFELDCDYGKQDAAIALVGERVKGVRAKWKNGRSIELVSKELSGEGSVKGSRGPVRFFTNRNVHDCFSLIAYRVIPALHTTCPIATIEIEVIGQTVALDDKN